MEDLVGAIDGGVGRRHVTSGSIVTKMLQGRLKAHIPSPERTVDGGLVQDDRDRISGDQVLSEARIISLREEASRPGGRCVNSGQWKGHCGQDGGVKRLICVVGMTIGRVLGARPVEGTETADHEGRALMQEVHGRRRCIVIISWHR